MPFEKSVLVPLNADETFALITATVPEGLAAFVLGVAGKIITPEIRSSGSFADAVPAGPDADVMDRLIAFTGRNVLAGRTA